MEVFKTIVETKKYIKSQICLGKSVGFVPTMGALHKGHISLIERANAENDLVVASIFVNPTQFGNPEDLVKYPKTLEADCALLKPARCDVVFAPSAEEMYVNLPDLKLNFGHLEHVMEGAFRPDHFNGVGIVVSKLFHIVNPDRAYFGLKDLQQVAILTRLVKDLSFDLELIPCPIIRELDGLAMSSRNTRLSHDARKSASQISIATRKAKDLMIQGGNSLAIKEAIFTHFKAYPEFEMEYLEISDFEQLTPIDRMMEGRKTAICIAAYLDKVRLIDNIVF
jgi:pantoate--beta-alanine ligase